MIHIRGNHGLGGQSRISTLPANTCPGGRLIGSGSERGRQIGIEERERERGRQKEIEKRVRERDIYIYIYI